MHRKQNQITFIIKEADKEMSPADIDFIYDLLTKWLIRDYVKRNQEVTGCVGKTFYLTRTNNLL